MSIRLNAAATPMSIRLKANGGTASLRLAQGRTGPTGPAGPQGEPGPTLPQEQMDAINATIAPQVRAGLRWIPAGDSLSSPEGGGAPYMGWHVQAGMLSDGQITQAINAGITGNNAADLRARLQTDVLDHNPTVVTVWIGTNDITQSRTLTDYQADVTAILDTIESAGARPILLTIPPRADNTKHDTISAWNLWLRDYAFRRKIDLVDAYAAVVDPTTGTYKTGYDSGDGIHMTQTGHNAVAQAFVDTMSTRLPAGSVLRPRLNVDANNLLLNPLLLTDSNADNIPDSWTIAGTATGHTGTLVNDPDFFGGKAWEVASVNPAGLWQFRQNATTAWSPGDELLVVAKVKIVSASGVSSTKGLRINANFFGGSPAVQAHISYVRLPGLQGVVAKRYTVPAGTTGPVQLACLFDYDTTASATVRVGEFAIYNLTALGLA